MFGKSLDKNKHFLITKLRKNNIDGLIVGIQDEKNKDFITNISQLCDKVIDISDTSSFV